MKFRDFILKHVLAPTDYLVGYDADGNYIRISKNDLATTLGVSQVSAQSILVQYSADGSTWHDTYTSGDVYMRIKVGSGSWSAAIRIAVSAYDVWKEENGGTGTVQEFLTAIQGPAGEDAEGSIDTLAGYDALISTVSGMISTATGNLPTSADITALQTSVETINATLASKADKDDENTEEVAMVDDNSFVYVMGANGMKKISLKNLSRLIKIGINSGGGSGASLDTLKIVCALTGAQDGSNQNYTCAAGFGMGTTDLYLNGQRLVRGVDYNENSAYSISLITHTPIATDVLVLVAYPYNVE